MEVYSKDINSISHWDKIAKDYVQDMNNKYHAHRLSMIRQLYQHTDFYHRQCFDFGCGDGVTIIEFLDKTARCWGIDASVQMIALARKSLRKKGYSPDLAQVGTVSDMAKIPSNSLDVVTSFNVLAYLDNQEIDNFYRQAYRVLKKNGELIVTHSNELFDIYSLNSYTVEFFAKYFYEGDKAAIKSLLKQPNKPEIVTFNIRVNPLNYQYTLKKYGFKEVQQEFSNLHNHAPSLLSTAKDYPDTLNYCPEDKWKLMFMCSTFGSRSVKR